jgi:uncharacterized protein (TIGR02270 family)
LRSAIYVAGIAGQPEYVPWLLKKMTDVQHARIAGESFSLITGFDLFAPGFSRTQPQDYETLSEEDPGEEGMTLDRDDDLPWPDSAALQSWWSSGKSRFTERTRYFLGEPISSNGCGRVLREGYQRQRTLAAIHLSLLNPSTALFNTAAPAWRQQRLLNRKV